MPARPTWVSDLNHIVQELRSSPRPFVDRATVEALLGVGRRRAQQILAPCITDHVGSNGLANREQLIIRLQQMADGEEGRYEVQRRHRVAQFLKRLRQERMTHPQLPVEAPLQVINQKFDQLPPGVYLEPGRLCVEFNAPQEALEKLLALAMAISNDFDQFERHTRSD